MFQEVDPVLGPEMRSTGEVLGIASQPGEAFFKAQEAAGSKLPLSGTVLFALSDSDKPNAAELAEKYIKAGFKILATKGTYEVLNKSGVNCECVGVNRPDVLDFVINGQVQRIINTPREKVFTHTGSALRRGAVRAKIPYVTTLAAARAAIEGILTVKAQNNSSDSLKSIKEWHSLIK